VARAAAAGGFRVRAHIDGKVLEPFRDEAGQPSAGCAAGPAGA
jgi:hypothetical protein